MIGPATLAALQILGSAVQGTSLRMTVSQAVSFALDHHPALAAQRALLAVSRAEVSGSRAALLPSADLSGEIDRGSANVIAGTLFPLPGLPAVSGPPVDRPYGQAEDGSEVAATVSWELSDLPRRIELLDASLSRRAGAEDQLDEGRLAVAFGAADRFLGTLALEQTVAAARADLERGAVFVRTVKALTDQSLRPGADLSRAQAEAALASTRLARAEQSLDEERVALSAALGIPGVEVVPEAGRLLETPMGPDPDRPVGSHPLVRAAEESATAARLDAGAAKLEYLPRLAALGALWARGSGFVSGSVGPSPDGGLTPDSRNWAVGLVLTWPALGTLGTHARALAANARWEVASARFEEVTQDVQSQIESARVGLEGARRVAANTPVAMSAARTNEQQAVARYKAGLNSVSDVAEAERLLAAAESDDASAHLAVWRALLVLSRSTGDLQPFLAESAEGGR